MDIKSIEIHSIALCDAHRAEIRECSFTNSDVHSCFMDYTRVNNSRWGNASFEKMFMMECRFDDVNLNNSLFHNLAMLSCDFDKVTLNESSIANSAMLSCSFTNSNISNSKFVQTDLSGVEIGGDCVIDGMTIDGIPVEELLRAYKENNGQ